MRQRSRLVRAAGTLSGAFLLASATGVTLNFGEVAPGRYALLHDENGNGRADRAPRLMPQEGYGFSRDAPVVIGPPSFRQAAFDVARAPVRQTIRLRYLP